jgi:transcription antitermination factor NusG
LASEAGSHRPVAMHALQVPVSCLSVFRRFWRQFESFGGLCGAAAAFESPAKPQTVARKKACLTIREEANEMTNALWYALSVRPRFESVVVRNLSAKGYEVFLPTYISKRRWSDRTKSVESALFPGYLFCRLDVQQRLPILITPGVRFIVSRGKIPEPIDQSELNAVRLVMERAAVYEPHPYLTVGQAVRIKRGSLYGLTGVAIQIKDNCRLIISVNLLQRSVAVDIDRTWIEPISFVDAKGSLPPAAGM